MRLSITVLFIIVSGVVAGCAANSRTQSNVPAAAGPEAAGGVKDCVMQSGGVDVLRVSLAGNIKCEANDGSLHVNAKQYDVYLWLVPGAKTLDDGIAQIGQQIKDQFKDFQAKSTSDLTVAGSPAKRLIGKGHEADDGDNGEADVIVFKVGDRIFIACVHGEDLTPMAEQGILTVLRTARLP